jgi:hypothetical protein
MAQMHLYVPAEVAKQLKERARALGMPVSRYLTTVVRRELGNGWPEAFFDQVIGQWQGAPLKRPPQGNPEEREIF